jgi:hypothetical protein
VKFEKNGVEKNDKNQSVSQNAFGYASPDSKIDITCAQNHTEL